MEPEVGEAVSVFVGTNVTDLEGTGEGWTVVFTVGDNVGTVVGDNVGTRVVTVEGDFTAAALGDDEILASVILKTPLQELDP